MTDLAGAVLATADEHPDLIALTAGGDDLTYRALGEAMGQPSPSVVVPISIDATGADPAALERFGIPAARVRPTTGNSISSLEDLLAGEVREANAPAQALGIVVGMRGRDAFARL